MLFARSRVARALLFTVLFYVCAACKSSDPARNGASDSAPRELGGAAPAATRSAKPEVDFAPAAAPGAAPTTSPTSAPAYENGRQLCARRADVVGHEAGFYVSVPVRYEEPRGAQTFIYAWWARPFDAAKPSYVLFTGGPGQSSHLSHVPKFEFFARGDWNLLMFDQRGIACSRAETRETQNDPNFYSSEYTARDFEEIRKFVNVEQMSVYGASYGTVPATIYASLFPAHTRAVVLEGIVFTGFELMYGDQARIHRVQRMWDSLPSAVRSAALGYAQNEGGMNLAGMAEQLMKSRGQYGVDELREKISVAFATVPSRPDILRDWWMRQMDSGEDNRSIEMSQAVNVRLFCKELGANQAQIAVTLRLSGEGKVTAVPGSNPYPELCVQAGLGKAGASTYRASDYPVSVPLTYLQGGGDAATIPLGAIEHWRRVPQGTAQLLILVGGGHMPVGQLFNDPAAKKQSDLMREVFFTALAGRSVGLVVPPLNAAGPYHFAVTSKAPEGAPTSAQATAP